MMMAFRVVCISRCNKHDIDLPFEQIEAFTDYWTEPARNGKKQRYQMQKTWDLSGRLRTWERNYRTRFGMDKEGTGNKKLEHEIGSIRAGKKADFTILEADPYETPLKDLKDIPIWGTVFEGRPFEITR